MATPLGEGSIELGVKVTDWRGAIEAAGHLLESTGSSTAEYTEAMIKTVEDNGPYIVIAPGIALAHARPEAGAKDSGVALVTLKPPITFGHPGNDPVSIVIAFAAVDPGNHIATLSVVARFLSDPGRVQAICTAQSPRQVAELFNGFVSQSERSSSSCQCSTASSLRS